VTLLSPEVSIEVNPMQPSRKRFPIDVTLLRPEVSIEVNPVQ